MIHSSSLLSPTLTRRYCRTQRLATIQADKRALTRDESGKRSTDFKGGNGRSDVTDGSGSSAVEWVAKLAQDNSSQPAAEG